MSKYFDKKDESEVIQKLEKLGLSRKDASVYLFLLQRTSEVGSSKIILGTGLHSQYVYNSLQTLEERGLVKHVIKNGRKKWSANSPRRIESLVEEKRIVANEVLGKLEAIFTRRHEQDFEVFQGEDQFVAHQFQLLQEAKDGDYLDVIGLGDQFPKILGERRYDYNSQSVEKGRVVRFIGAEDQEEYLRGVKEKLQNFDYRILPGFHGGTVATSIRPESISFQIYGTPLLCFTIRSEQLAKDYRKFFEALWELSKQ